MLLGYRWSVIAPISIAEGPLVLQSVVVALCTCFQQAFNVLPEGLRIAAAASNLKLCAR